MLMLAGAALAGVGVTIPGIGSTGGPCVELLAPEAPDPEDPDGPGGGGIEGAGFGSSDCVADAPPAGV